jgi:hypothetical protein
MIPWFSLSFMPGRWEVLFHSLKTKRVVKEASLDTRCFGDVSGLPPIEVWDSLGANPSRAPLLSQNSHSSPYSH